MFLSTHLYFAAALYFFIFWILLFAVNERARKQMFIVSLFGLILGPFAEVMHLVDWWHPNFVFNSFVKIEDLLFGFAFAGIVCCVYNILAPINETSLQGFNSWYKLSVVGGFLFLLFGLFYIFHTSSFWSSIISSLFALVMVGISKRQLLPAMLLTGLFMVIIATPGYFLGVYIHPGWVSQEWFTGNLSGVSIMTVPIEEFLWFFFAGSSLSALVELFCGDERKRL
jgi:hypothetical protein